MATMGKYYVQSGNVRMIMHAHDARAAAIWLVQRTIGQVMPFLAEDPERHGPHGEAPQLSETILVSERGFDRDDAELHGTLAVVTEWNRLLVALDRLQAQFEQELSAV
jgi:hypothetical protein